MTPIGIFDSGYGGLTILRHIRELLPQYDYLYLGDNARTPYGPRSYDVIRAFSLQAVKALFQLGCKLIIIACNTASAKALRTIQQRDLPQFNDPLKRVLGIIRPTAEIIPHLTRSRHVGILATAGTINAQSYNIEIQKQDPDITVTGQACPLWVPLVENNELDSPATHYLVNKNIRQLLQADPQTDTILLACTHYPLLLPVIRQHTPAGIRLITQGTYVAQSLKDYLFRHKNIENSCTKGSSVAYLTTENPDFFNRPAARFMNAPVQAQHINIDNL